MSEEILKVLEKLKNKSNYQRDCNDGSYFIELFANEIYILCKFMEDLQQKVEQLEKEVNEYQKELEKADSITQSCIFQGKQESKISFRNCLNRLEQLENIRKEAIEYVLKNKLYRFKYDDEELFEITTDKKAKDDLLNILNKGSDKE